MSAAVLEKKNGTTGRNAADTLKGGHPTEAIYGPQMVKRTAIRPDPTQPRKVFADGPLKELATSIQKQGVLQRLIVEWVPAEFTLHEPDLTSKFWTALDSAGKEVSRGLTDKKCVDPVGGQEKFEPYFRLLIGERRWRASGLTNPPLEMLPVDVRRPLTDKERLTIQLEENDKREGLSPLDEAQSFHDAVNVRKLFTADELAGELGKSRSHVYGRLKLAALPKVVKEAVAAGTLNSALADLVARVPGEKNQLRAMKEILEGGEMVWNHPDRDESARALGTPMSVRKAQAHLKDKYMLELEDAKFDVKDAKLLPAAGSCKDCPKRTGNCEGLFPEIKNPNVCTDPDCFQKKVGAHIEAARQKAIASGLGVLPAAEAKQYFKYGGFDPYHQLTAKLSDEIPGDKKKRTYKELLGKDAPPKVAAVDTDGTVHEFYQKELLEAALVQKGFSFNDPEARQQSAPKETPEQMEAREKLKELREGVAEAAIVMVLKVVRELPSDEKGMLQFLKLAADLLMDNWQARRTFEAREVTVGADSNLPGLIAKMKLPDLRSFMVEAGLSRSNLVFSGGDFGPELKMLCEFASVDLKALEKAAVAKAGEPAPGAKFEQKISANAQAAADKAAFTAKAKKKKK